MGVYEDRPPGWVNWHRAAQKEYLTRIIYFFIFYLNLNDILLSPPHLCARPVKILSDIEPVSGAKKVDGRETAVFGFSTLSWQLYSQVHHVSDIRS